MKRKPFAAIYAIIHKVSGRIYVGSAVNLYTRWEYHRSNFRRKTHCNEYLLRAWEKYGPEAFEWVVLEVVTNLDELLKTEQYWIDYCEACDRKKGFNISPTAGNNRGAKLSEETKARINMGRRKGYKQTEHQKKTVSEALKGNTHGAGSHYCGHLTEDNVKAIIDLLITDKPTKEIADLFNVTGATISRIARRQIWYNVPISPETEVKLKSLAGRKAKGSATGRAKLTEADIPIIRSRIANNEKLSSIARSYNVTEPLIGAIKKGRIWSHVNL